MVSLMKLSCRGTVPQYSNQENRQSAGHEEIKPRPAVPLPSSTSKFPLDSAINFD
jgi:hypothetical protein